ncbi:virulence factor Mce family protein [Mycobacterium cookii]|uniref:Mammalian cell entry protein n=1 Tax=Mycobacterium cookii TaxID=1775 RepID=A0A7I7L051_9MYCO|nr:MlaD family protein [Mycobacterium cookii]MCV7330386.1 MCE family protein [Mycobacterium cookii]BBX47427.1 mammalian cell entry protein [Mycobacterium cookii]
MLTRFIRNQLIVFAVLTLAAIVALGWFYLRIPSQLGIGQYRLVVELPASGGLYRTSNVTYRGIQIGRVTKVEPTAHGVRAILSIDDRYKIPIDASANVHSVSAIGEQYVDLVSTGDPGKFFAPGQTITNGSVPSEIGPALDAANRGLSVLPKHKIASLLEETSLAVGGLGPALERLVDSTQSIVGDFEANLSDVDDVIANAAPIIDSQVNSGDSIAQWSRNLKVLTAEIADNDQHVQSVLAKAAPTADQVNRVFGDVRESLPQTIANLEIVGDMLKRYNKGLEQLLVFLPEIGSVAQTLVASAPGSVLMNLDLSLNNPPPCLTGFLPASEWRSPAETSVAPLPAGTYCKIPQDTQANDVRGARNYPCVDVPGKRRATPKECRDNKPYVPLGTNPWYGDPNQIRNCPAPGARCDQPVDPGRVIPAPSVNNGMNPIPADRLAVPPSLTNDPLQRPGSGHVQCNGQQPNPCIYTPAAPSAIYLPSSGEIVGPDGAKYSLEDSRHTGDGGWKDMLAPAG